MADRPNGDARAGFRALALAGAIPPAGAGRARWVRGTPATRHLRGRTPLGVSLLCTRRSGAFRRQWSRHIRRVTRTQSS